MKLSPAERIERAAAARALIEKLAERWPRCFSVYEKRRRPLKLGIHHDILAAFDGSVTPADLSNAMRYYVGNRGYLRYCREGVDRIGLDGEPAGKVSAKEAGNAVAILAGRAAAAVKRAGRRAGGAKPGRWKWSSPRFSGSR